MARTSRTSPGLLSHRVFDGDLTATGRQQAAHLDVQGWAPVFDLDPLLPLRRRPPRRPTGRLPLVTAVIARAA
jgi:hypothetical protein